MLNLNSLSLSLIDDRNKQEILFVSITSSGINWGQKLSNKLKVFKAFPTHKIERIETVYQKYLQDVEADTDYKTYMIDEDEEVDFERMVLLSGKNELQLQRHFASSVYLNLFNSLIQTTLHLIIHKLQVEFCYFFLLFIFRHN